MVYKCGKEITPHVPTITNLCLRYICYDPNYNYDDGDDEEDMECDEEVNIKFVYAKLLSFVMIHVIPE